MQICFVRHGETDKNVAGVVHASGDQEHLNENGRKQIELTALKLSERPIQKVYSSQELRAVESAEIIASVCGCPLEQIEGFQERDWGIHTGKPWSEISAILSPMSLEDRYLYTPEGGESWKNFEERLIATLHHIISQSEEHVVIVSHGGAIRALMPHLLDKPREESFKYDPPNASISIFFYENGVFKAENVLDVSHLPEKG